MENLPSSDDYGGFDETTELWDSVAPKAEDGQQYLDGGDGYGGQVVDDYDVNGQHYENNDVVYNDDGAALAGGSGEEEMMGVEGAGIDQNYYTNQQLLQQDQQLQQQRDFIHFRELKETIEKVGKL